MSATREELIEFLNEAEERGDMAAANAVLDKLESMPAQEVQQEAYGEPVMQGEQYQVGNKVAERPSLAAPVDMNERYAADVHQQGVDMAAGVAEPAMAYASGMAAAPVAQIGGGIQQALSPTNPLAGFQSRDRIQDFFTYKPRTQAGQEAMLSPESAPAQAMGAVDEFVHRGEEVYDATGSESLAILVEALPSWASAALMSLGLKKKPQAMARKVTRTEEPKGFSLTKTGRVESGLSEKGQIKQALTNQVADPRTAKWKIAPGGEMVIDDLYKAASKQGWPDPVITMAKHGSMNPANKQKYLEMVHTTKRALKDIEWGASNRPTQVVGESVLERFNFLKQTNKILGKAIDDVARGSLAGKYIDHGPLFQAFDDFIVKFGGKVNDKGKLVFPPGARLAGQASNQKGLATIKGQINALGPNPNAYQLHILKQNIDDFVTYGKAPGSQGAVTGKTQGALKSLRNGINKKLQGVSDNYDSVNTGFADTKGALDQLSEAFGKTIYGEGAEKVTGVKMRQWIGNAPNRTKVMNAFKNSDDIARKYGGTFNDTAEGQVVLANALDDILTTQITRSSLKGDVKGATGSMLQKARQSTLSHVEDAATAAKNAMSNINDEAALSALEDIIRATSAK